MPLKSKDIKLDLAVKCVAWRHWAAFLWLFSFCAGMFIGSRMWMVPQAKQTRRSNLVSEDCDTKFAVRSEFKNTSENVSKIHHNIEDLNNRIRDLEHEVHSAKPGSDSSSSGLAISSGKRVSASKSGRKYLMVVGINTAFGSKLRRASLRETWMPNGEKRRKLEEEKGIVIRFVIGQSPKPGSALDKAVEAEEEEYGDFMRLEHIEGYHHLSAKTKTYFATAIALWDADYYVKIDDDVHLNLGTLAKILVSHSNKPRVYIGCMKSGPVLHQKGVRYHEPEYLKFGDKGNNYFRHATGQIYAISKELAAYIAENKDVLHKYANEDVSLGAWFIGLEVEHISDRRFCCGSTIECELRAHVGRTCAATFEWKCSGICSSYKRIKGIHRVCGEDENSLWHTYY